MGPGLGFCPREKSCQARHGKPVPVMPSHPDAPVACGATSVFCALQGPCYNTGHIPHLPLPPPTPPERKNKATQWLQGNPPGPGATDMPGTCQALTRTASPASRPRHARASPTAYQHLALLPLDNGNAHAVHLNQDFAHIGHSGVPTMLVLGLNVEVGQGGGVGAHFGQGVGAVAHEVVRHLVKGVVVRVTVDVADAVGLFEALRFSVLHPAVLARRARGIGALDFASPRGTRALGGAGVVRPEL